ncbi:hypothetical protein ZWY2020_058297 [Hordeum vulgare]|nr:hypothetical protein ZWY2020_058297 [Hordeum vulgare]
MEEDEAEEDEEDQPAPGLTMVEAHAEFAIAQAEEMLEQDAILDSIQDEAKVLANHMLIPHRHAKADALFDELDAEIAIKEVATEQSEASEGTELWLPPMDPPEGTEIIDISDEE